MITTQEGAARGERLRDNQIARATTGKESLIVADELRFLNAIAGSPDGTATSDDAVDDLSKRFCDGGKWRGATPLRLARQGLIVEAGFVRSCRPSRHRSKITVWEIADRDRVNFRRGELRELLAAIDAEQNATGPETAISEPVENSSINPQSIEGKSSRPNNSNCRCQGVFAAK